MILFVLPVAGYVAAGWPGVLGALVVLMVLGTVLEGN